MKIYNLIAGPRNLSTAIMYAFAQRKDMQVIDEPFYGYYLKNAVLNIAHPSHNEVLESMELQEEKIIDAINSRAEKSALFLKGMAHHYLTDAPEFILDWENILLIRRPEKLICSFAKVVSNPTLSDIGLKKSAELYRFLEQKGKCPIVIDSDELLACPKIYLQELCTKLKLPYSDDMLHWKKGGLPEDGIWAKHWYKNLHLSEGFQTKKNTLPKVPKHLQGLLKEALPYYAILRAKVLTNPVA